MGTDIHFYVEKRQPDGTWRSIDKWTRNDCCDDWSDRPEMTVAWGDSFYSDRNYQVFAMLAGVRATWFAGADGGLFVPISKPRGLPDDVSPLVAADGSDWGHDHSWFTVEELMAVDWYENKITQRGWVDPSTFHRWDKRGIPPERWARVVTGPNVEHLTNEEMRDAFPSTVEPRRTTYYTLIEWTLPWSEALGSFAGVLLRLFYIAKDDPAGTRIVFWFDS